MKLTIIVFIAVLQTAKCNISGSEKLITALIRSYFQGNDEYVFHTEIVIFNSRPPGAFWLRDLEPKTSKD